jgi:hypothetical protein
MRDAPRLRPAPPDEIADALSFAPRYHGRKRVHHADDMMARITAERLVQHLEASGLVVMKGQPAPAPTTANMPPPGVETSVCRSRNVYGTGAALRRSPRCRPSGRSCRVAARNRPGRPGNADSPFFVPNGATTLRQKIQIDPCPARLRAGRYLEHPRVGDEVLSSIRDERVGKLSGN